MQSTELQNKGSSTGEPFISISAIQRIIDFISSPMPTKSMQ